MSGYRQLLYHIVFRTQDSQPTINAEYASNLYRKAFEQEYRALLMESGIKTDERYFP